jgi:tetratricopeptide (TPR) repeat protein
LTKCAQLAGTLRKWSNLSSWQIDLLDMSAPTPTLDCIRGLGVKRLLRVSIAVGMGIIVAIPGRGQNATAGGSRRSAALSLEQQGRLSDAETAWQALAKSNPSDSEAFAHLGLLEAREEHYKEAVPYYRKALALNPRMPGLRMNLGLAYFKGGDLRLAVSTFQPLLQAAPKDSAEAERLTTLIGLADYGLGAYANAVPHLKQAIATDPQNLPFRMMLVHACLWSKQYQCVLDIYHEILTLNAESAEADMLAGEAYDEMKNEAGAIEQFQAAIKADPKAQDAHFGYGYLLWRKAKYEEAENEFRTELANNPDQPLALTYLADTEIRFGHFSEAAPLLEHAIRIQSSIELAYVDLGTAYQGEGRNDDSLREFKEAEQRDPTDPTVHWRLGKLYRAMGRRVEANAELDKTQGLLAKRNESLREQMNQVEFKSIVQNADHKAN